MGYVGGQAWERADETDSPYPWAITTAAGTVARDLVAMVTDERTDLAGSLAGSAPEQWRAASLCEERNVQDVVNHLLSYEDLGLAAVFLRGRLRPNRIDEVCAAACRDPTPEQLRDRLRGHLVARGSTAGAGKAPFVAATLLSAYEWDRPGRP